MKKIFLAFAAVAMMASCTKEAGYEPSFEEYQNDAIKFSTYNTFTRGTVTTVKTFKDDGIGVFAFYQPAVNGRESNFTTTKYATPDFMYNQQVELNQATGIWSYTPVKYWPNNYNDQLSFFAYAPYVSETSWEDLGIITDGTGKKMNKTFVIYNDVESQIDYLFAEPTLNKPKPSTIKYNEAAGNAASADASGNDDIVMFDFEHVLSKINLYLGVEADNTYLMTSSSDASGEPAINKWTDETTDITIKSIEFKGLAQNRIWSYNVDSNTSSWKSEGSQDIKVTPSDADGADIIKAASGDPAGWSDVARWHRVLAASGDSPEETDDDDQYMFLAPTNDAGASSYTSLKDNKIVITYVVKTTDSGNALNNSEITNVITKTWNDFHNDEITTLKAGKQYRLFFIIGMQSVKMAADITDWEDAEAPEGIIYLPAANEPGPNVVE